METVQVDDLLLPFVRAQNAAESERLLSDLIVEHAEPIVNKIVNYKIRSARRGSSNESADTEAEDVCGEVMLQLVQRLQSFRDDHTRRPIADFNAYVAVTTYNAYDRYISRKYPQRRRLKNGLRYLLTHRNGFALWQAKDETWVGGLSRWQQETDKSINASEGNGAQPAPASKRPQQLRDDPRAFALDAKIKSEWHDPKHGYELLSALFAWTNAPVEIDLLTSIVAEWWNVTDDAVELDAGFEAEGREESARVQIADKGAGADIETERRVYLQRLWEEIGELLPRQRAALLLNLRDEGGRGIVDLWIIVGIATPEAMAAALSMDREAFAELWKELPLEDNRIAELLGLTRQQVINLRKSARERLARRIKAF
jgi:RNA polymerase sigma factor (sigma-70 family)